MRKWLGKSRGIAPLKRSALVEKETSVVKVTYEAKGFWDIEVQKTGDIIFDEVQMPNIGQNLEPGEPSLPQEGLYVAIPKGATVIDVRVVKSKMKSFKLSHPVKPAPEPTTDPSGLPALNPKQSIYKKDIAFPGVLFKNLGTKQVGDINVVHLMLYPVQYHPTSNVIDLHKKIELEVEYEYSAKGPLRGPPTRGVRKRVPTGYEDQILNFDNI
ncbi:MAG: C25 family peptidase propeptide domain-containing protein [Promethearchaeota archaeon]